MDDNDEIYPIALGNNQDHNRELENINTYYSRVKRKNEFST